MEKIEMTVWTQWNPKLKEDLGKPKCVYKKEVPISFIPNRGEMICIKDGFCLEEVTEVFKSYEPKLSVEVHINTVDEYNEYGPSLVGKKI